MAFRNSRQHRWIRLASRQFIAFRCIEQLSAVEWVDVGRKQTVIVLKQEMARKADSEYRLLQAPRDLHINHRQRDGNARLSRQHLVKARSEERRVGKEW